MRNALTLLAAVALTTACSHRDDTASANTAESDSIAATVNSAGRVVQRAAARAGVVTTAPTNAPGAVVIHTTDNKMTLTLAHDTVSMGLSDSVLADVKQKMASDTNQHGLAGAFSGFIKKTVSSALHSRVAYPVQDIQDAKYENGRIEFTYRQPREMKFEDVTLDHGDMKVGGGNAHDRKALDSFAPADAQRFVQAVDSAIAATRGH